MPIPPSRCVGFTLVELLVLVAIISVLASMLLPAAATVLTRANSVRCQNNLRQLQTANIAYAGDWEGCFVPSFRYDAGGGWSYPWIDNTEYVDLLYRAANDKFKAAVASSLNVKQLCPLSRKNKITSQIGSSYGYNHGLKSIPSYRPVYLGSKDTDDNIANRAAFMDGLSWGVSLTGADPTRYWLGGGPRPEGTVVSQQVAYRHRGQANVAFFDGHVAAVAPLVLFDTDLWYAP